MNTETATEFAIEAGHHANNQIQNDPELPYKLNIVINDNERYLAYNILDDVLNPDNIDKIAKKVIEEQEL